MSEEAEKKTIKFKCVKCGSPCYSYWKTLNFGNEIAPDVCLWAQNGKADWQLVDEAEVEQSTEGDEMSDTLSSGHEEAKALYNAAKRVI